MRWDILDSCSCAQSAPAQSASEVSLLVQDTQGNAAEASNFLSGCLEAAPAGPSDGQEACSMSSPDAPSPLKSSLEAHSAPTGILERTQEPKKGRRAGRMASRAAIDGFVSMDEALLNSGGISSGPDTDTDDVFASWDRLLQDGGHGSSPTSAVAVVQVHCHPVWPQCPVLQT